MESLLDELFALYDIDQELISLKNQLAKGPVLVEQAEAAVTATRQARKETELAVRETMTALDACNLELKTNEEELEEQEVTLKDIKNSKEYRIVTDRIKNIKQRTEVLENSALEYMQTLEELRATLQARQEELAAQEEKHSACQAKTESEALSVRKVGKELKQKRNAQFEKIHKLDDVVAEEYKSAFLRSKGTALAEMKDGTCQACFRHQNPQTENIVKVGRDVRRCRCLGCGRILYIKHKDAAAEPRTAQPETPAPTPPESEDPAP